MSELSYWESLGVQVGGCESLHNVRAAFCLCNPAERKKSHGVGEGLSLTVRGHGGGGRNLAQVRSGSEKY